MKAKNGVIFLLTISLLTVFSGCGKDKAVSNVMTLATSFSAQEAEAYLADFDFDYQKQSEKDIKSSKDETIRKLSDYKIKYNVYRNDISSAMAALMAMADPESAASQKEKKNAKDLTVISWGPQNVIPGYMRNPEFFVGFSQPVKELAALEAPMETCDVFTVTPSVKGKYRWTGTRTLVFLPSEPLVPTQIYTITVNPALKSLDGVVISGDTIFKTASESVKLRNVKPGTTMDKNYYYSSSSGVPLDKAGDAIVTLNMPLSADEFKQYIKVSYLAKNRNYSVSAVESYYDEKAKSSKYRTVERSAFFYIHIDGSFEANSIVELIANDGTDNASSIEYNVLKSFSHNYTDFNDYNFTVSIRFTQPVQKSTVASNVTITSEAGENIKVSDKNVTVNGSTVILRELPFEYDKDYTLYVNTGLKDIFGQNLQYTVDSTIKVPKAASYLEMLDRGNKILEAQYPHKFIIEHQNLNSGAYAVEKVNDPLTSSYRSGKEITSSNRVELKTAHDNLTHIDVIELDPYLKNGLGFVRVSANASTHKWDYWDKKYYDYTSDINVCNIQVTDLGVTARAGYDKVVALVRKLSDDTPVKNATVILYSNSSYHDEEIESGLRDPLASGKTDANGYVEFEVRDSKIQQVIEAQYNSRLALFVESGNDKVTYNIDNHSPWRFGIYSTSFKNEFNKNRNLVFMFTDRGLYRPGETVSFKGIAKHLDRHGLSSMSGNYTVKLEKHTWEEDETYGTLSTTLSSAGGFSGSFIIPKDVKPGTLTIGLYNGSKRIAYEDLTVAFFEKVKFQASASVPDVTYYLGDSITAELSASYLAGGSLTGASYDAYWYKQATSYVPPVPEAADYVFGPEYSNYSSTYISEAKGSVNDGGPTRISCNTAPDVIGQAYVYSAEIGVTDISNQRIFTGAAKVVHPGLFYIGAIKRIGAGFPKTKEKVEIPFVLMKPDGSYASAELVNGKVDYTITRSYWTYLNEDSVDGMYSRWEEVTETVETGKVNAASKGSITFTPQKAGRYKLSITAVDKKSNNIKTDKSFYVTGSDYWWYDSDNASALRLTPDRNFYKAGDTAKLLLESPLTSGDYLVTVERDTIISSEVMHIDSPCTQIEIPVKEEYLPVVYVSICSYSKREGEPTHKYGEPDLGKPKGYYGVTEIFVDKEQASFKVDVTSAKDTYRPGEEVTFDILATKDGKPVPNAELTVMVVDRAVIDLINYHVSDPLSFFYNSSNYPLAVVGGDSRSYLMDPVTYKVKSLQGGDAENDAGSDEKQERKDFRPTALFEPEIITDENGKAKVTFKLPDSLTTYRVTAFGVAENLFSLQESEVKVQNPINVQAVQPRRLRVRDTAEAGVIVTNLDNKNQKVTVSVSVRGPQSNYDKDTEKGLITTAGSAFIDDKTSKTITVPAGKTMPVYFNVGAEAAGNIELVFDVKSDVLKEKLISMIEIEKPYTYETVAVTGMVESSSPDKKEKVSETEKVIIPSWCEDGMGEIEITLDPTQIGLMGSSVRYVFDYPYGCLEQQSSKMWPLITFGDYIDTFGLKSKVDDPRKVVTSWFATVKKEQHGNGAFPYWPGSTYDNYYVSLRFLHMYKLAIDRGYTPKEIGYNEEDLRRYIKYELSKMKELNNSYVAYACYVLSLYDDKAAETYLDSLYKYCNDSKATVNLSTAAYTALAYQNMADKDKTAKKRAKDLGDKIRSSIKQTGRSVSLDAFQNNYGYIYGMYYNESETLATLMQLYVMQKPNDELVNKLLFTLLAKQKSGYWQSTATTARVFEAIYVLIKQRKLEGLNFVSTAVIDGKTKLAEGNFKGLGSKPVTQVYSFKSAELKNIKRNTPASIEFTKDGKGTLYYTALMRYAIPEELCAARDEGFEVNLKITDEDGNEITTVSPESKVIILEAGKSYKFTTTYTTTQNRNYVAFRVPVPSGAEIVDSSLSTGASKNTTGDTAQSRGGYYDYYDDWYCDDKYEYFYDNEAQYFDNYMWAGTSSQTITVRAARKGVYPTPPVTAECMYEPEVFGRADGYLFIIK